MRYPAECFPARSIAHFRFWVRVRYLHRVACCSFLHPPARAVLSKWDLVRDRRSILAAAQETLETSLPQVKGVPLVSVSGRTGDGVARLMSAVLAVYERWQRRVPTASLNRWLEEMVMRHPPPLAPGGRRLRLRYMTQAKGRPPTFVIFANRPSALADSYKRYLQNGLREAFDLDGVPIRIRLRKSENPYART